MKRVLAAVFLVAVSALLATAWAAQATQATQPTQPTRTNARIIDFDFAPVSLNVAVNTRVTWTNTGTRPHTVTDRGGTFDTNPIAPRGEGSITFTVPGTYHYFCRINPSRMNGTIVVESSGDAPVTRIEAVDPALPEERLRFVPDQVQVEAGSAIVFANVGGKPHTLTAEDRSFDSGVLPPGPEGGRFAGTNTTITLAKPGVYAFRCEIHPEAMKGTLTVTGQARASPAAASPAPRDVAVTMNDFSFSESEVSVAPGGRMAWRNDGRAAHTATFDDVPLDTGDVPPGETGELAAPLKPGSYSYRCTIHPERMRGVMVVVTEGTADPTRRAAASQPAVATGAAGPRRGISTLALVTVAIGAFLGGFGISAFARRRQSMSS